MPADWAAAFGATAAAGRRRTVASRVKIDLRSNIASQAPHRAAGKPKRQANQSSTMRSNRVRERTDHENAAILLHRRGNRQQIEPAGAVRFRLPGARAGIEP